MRLKLNVKIAVIRRYYTLRKKPKMGKIGKRRSSCSIRSPYGVPHTNGRRACMHMPYAHVFLLSTPHSTVSMTWSVSFGTRQGNAPGRRPGGSTPQQFNQQRKAEPRKIGTRRLQASKLLACLLETSVERWAFLRSRYKNRCVNLPRRPCAASRFRRAAATSTKGSCSPRGSCGRRDEDEEKATALNLSLASSTLASTITSRACAPPASGAE
jgi:hypothetical protein